MDTGYASLRELEDRCKVNLRLMDYEVPSYHCLGHFINEELTDTVDGIFCAVMKHICKKEHVDIQHLYNDDSKIEVNANKHSVLFLLPDMKGGCEVPMSFTSPFLHSFLLQSLRQYRTIRLRRLLENLCPDFVTFS